MSLSCNWLQLEIAYLHRNKILPPELVEHYTEHCYIHASRQHLYGIDCQIGDCYIWNSKLIISCRPSQFIKRDCLLWADAQHALMALRLNWRLLHQNLRRNPPVATDLQTEIVNKLKKPLTQRLWNWLQNWHLQDWAENRSKLSHHHKMETCWLHLAKRCRYGWRAQWKT
jgi:hypothetical protein